MHRFLFIRLQTPRSFHRTDSDEIAETGILSPQSIIIVVSYFLSPVVVMIDTTATNENKDHERDSYRTRVVANSLQGSDCKRMSAGVTVSLHRRLIQFTRRRCHGMGVPVSRESAQTSLPRLNIFNYATLALDWTLSSRLSTFFSFFLLLPNARSFVAFGRDFALLPASISFQPFPTATRTTRRIFARCSTFEFDCFSAIRTVISREMSSRVD